MHRRLAFHFFIYVCMPASSSNSYTFAPSSNGSQSTRPQPKEGKASIITPIYLSNPLNPCCTRLPPINCSFPFYLHFLNSHQRERADRGRFSPRRNGIVGLTLDGPFQPPPPPKTLKEAAPYRHTWQRIRHGKPRLISNPFLLLPWNRQGRACMYHEQSDPPMSRTHIYHLHCDVQIMLTRVSHDAT